MKSNHFIFVIVLSSIIFSCNVQQPTTFPQDELENKSINQLNSLIDYHNLVREFDDKVVMINFFSARCSRCRSEVPILRDLVDEFANKAFVLIGISIDPTKPIELETFSKDFGINYPIYQDKNGKIFESLGFLGTPIPVEIFYEKGGQQAVITQGGHSLAEFRQIIIDLLNF